MNPPAAYTPSPDGTPPGRREPSGTNPVTAGPGADVPRALTAPGWVLLAVFLALIAAVPAVQTLQELSRGERVQITDVFRYAPTSGNLRKVEETLKEKSWLQQAVRPVIQQGLLRGLNDGGAQAVVGRHGWLFYRPDLRALVEGDRPDSAPATGRWVEPAPEETRTEVVARAIATFRDQLRERGILLLVVPVPGKPSVYPDRLTSRPAAADVATASPLRALLSELERRGVPTVDLLPVFREARAASPADSLYLARDTHWTPRGARLAAEAVAARLRALQWAPVPTTAFRTVDRSVDRHGDILDMMQIPGLHDAYAPERVSCAQVLDPTLGPLVPGGSERPGAYRYPARKAPVLLLGDSFSRIYQYPEPRSLGALADTPAGAAAETADRQAAKRLLPGSAGFLSHLALALQTPVDAIVSDGGASTDVRRKLSVDPAMLEGKRVVIWEFVERDIALGRSGWADVPLPVALDPQP